MGVRIGDHTTNPSAAMTTTSAPANPRTQWDPPSLTSYTAWRISPALFCVEGRTGTGGRPRTADDLRAMTVTAPIQRAAVSGGSHPGPRSARPARDATRAQVRPPPTMNALEGRGTRRQPTPADADRPMARPSFEVPRFCREWGPDRARVTDRIATTTFSNLSR